MTAGCFDWVGPAQHTSTSTSTSEQHPPLLCWHKMEMRQGGERVNRKQDWGKHNNMRRSDAYLKVTGVLCECCGGGKLSPIAIVPKHKRGCLHFPRPPFLHPGWIGLVLSGLSTMNLS